MTFTSDLKEMMEHAFVKFSGDILGLNIFKTCGLCKPELTTAESDQHMSA